MAERLVSPLTERVVLMAVMAGQVVTAEMVAMEGMEEMAATEEPEAPAEMPYLEAAGGGLLLPEGMGVPAV
ncbi:hypothetical protein NTH60_004699, partial [Enterobacter ludwigii]|nr:hypothetical protein [Enterobacter ludwigii]